MFWTDFQDFLKKILNSLRLVNLKKIKFFQLISEISKKTV